MKKKSKTMTKKTAGIVGGSGYTGGELLRLLLRHPFVELQFVMSNTHDKKRVDSIHADLLGQTELIFQKEAEQCDVLFLCLPHKQSKPWLEQNKIDANTKIIDLGNDFRLDGKFEERKFIYGLPDKNKEQIKKADSIANPGCFATAIQLALLPLAKENENEIFVTGITGSTGAGVKPQDTTHFSWRNNNISAYKTLSHQHLGEINQTLLQISAREQTVNFVPWRGDFSRGIFISACLKTNKTREENTRIFEEFYKDSPFTHVSRNPVHMKQVVGTNNAAIGLEQEANQLVVHCCIDNLLKGASGQAVENMNLIFDWPQHTGLDLKAIVY